MRILVESNPSLVLEMSTNYLKTDGLSDDLRLRAVNLRNVAISRLGAGWLFDADTPATIRKDLGVRLIPEDIAE